MKLVLLLISINFINSELDVTKSSLILSRNAHVNGHVTFPCKSQVRTDGIHIILWYRFGSKQPFCIFDIRDGTLHKEGHSTRQHAHTHSAPQADVTFNRDTGTLLLANIAMTDAGLYVCRVEYMEFQTSFVYFNLTVIALPSKPKIFYSNYEEINSSLVVFKENQQVTLICMSSGVSRPHLKWLLDRDCVMSSAIDSNTSHLALRSVTLGRVSRQFLHRQLTCAVEGLNLTLARSTSLLIELVLAPLDVSIVNPPSYLRAYTSYDVVCQSSGSRPVPTFYWLVDEKRYKADKVLPSSNENISSVSISLSPDNTRKRLRLLCLSQNTQLPLILPLKTNITFSVLFKPDIKIILGVHILPDRIIEGNNIYFKCFVRANPRITSLNWLHNDRTIKFASSARYISVSNTLIIRNVSLKMAGNYTCEAFNIEGHSKAKPFFLNVQYVPKCKVSEKIKYFVPYKSIHVFCHLQANPPQIHVKWLQTVYKTNKKTYLKKFNTSMLSSTIELRFRDRNIREIKCWANNAVGIQTKPCLTLLKPAERPDIPRNCTVSQQKSQTRIQCVFGFHGGSGYQLLHLQLFDLSKITMNVFNRTSSEGCVTLDSPLLKGHQYLAVVRAFNVMGASASVRLRFNSTGQTTQTLAFSKVMIPFPLTVIVVLASVICIIVLYTWLSLLLRLKRH